MPNRVKLTVSRDKNMPPEFVKVFGWLSYLTTYLTTYGKRTENFIVKIRAKRAEKGKILAKKSQNNAFLAEKRSRNSLGAGCRGFESLHSDQNFDRKQRFISAFGHFSHFSADSIAFACFTNLWIVLRTFFYIPLPKTTLSLK